ncbi:MAG TPA: hypothetical protein VD996_08255 [Chitinophagaceae bacterium]|nr:hypothetical protein [Chitinophagaceae bacterium]
MKTLQTLSVLLLLSYNLYAQVTDFKLADYKYRTPLYEALAMDLDLNQNVAAGAGFNARLNAQLSHIRSYSTDARQHLSMRSVFLQPQFGGKKDSLAKYIDNALAAGVRYERQDRFFRNNYFLEAGGAIGGNTSSHKAGQKDRAQGEGQYHAYVELIAGVGKGRLEYIHDAQAALLILEDLYASGILRSKVDAATANRFAQLITNIKKRRVLDARRRTIYQLNQVDSFLRANKLIAQCDAQSMAIINDVLFFAFQNDLSGNINTLGDRGNFDWQRTHYNEGYESVDYGLIPQIEPYSDQQFRQHGTIMYARLVPQLRYNLFTNTYPKAAGGDSVVKSSFLLAAPGIEIGYEKHEALSLRWQRGYRGAFQYSYNTYLSAKPYDIENYRIAILNADYNMAYYPNSRTVVEGRLGTTVWFGDKNTGTAVQPNLRLNSGYFLSYNTVLRAELAVFYNFYPKGSTSPRGIQENLRIFLRHYFF